MPDVRVPETHRDSHGESRDGSRLQDRVSGDVFPEIANRVGRLGAAMFSTVTGDVRFERDVSNAYVSNP